MTICLDHFFFNPAFFGKFGNMITCYMILNFVFAASYEVFCNVFHNFVLCSFISNQLMFTTRNGRMHGSSLHSGKSCLSLFFVSYVLSGLLLRTQHGKSQQKKKFHFRSKRHISWLKNSVPTCFSLLDRYTYSDDGSEEFDRDDTTLTLIKPAPLPSNDFRSVPEARSVQDGNGLLNGDMEEDKTE